MIIIKQNKAIIFLTLSVFVISFIAFQIIQNNPIDLLINDEIWLMLDISRNDFVLSFKELLKNKGGVKWPLYKILFSISANTGWNHSWFIISGFICQIMILSLLLYLVLKEKFPLQINIFLIISLFFFLRSYSYFWNFHSLISFKQLESSTIIALSILSNYFYFKKKINLSLIFLILLNLFILLSGNTLGLASIIALTIVSFACSRLKENIVFKIILIFSTYLNYYYLTSGVGMLDKGIDNYFNLWKNYSWLIYFFINSIFDSFAIKANYILRSVVGSIIFIPLFIYIYFNRNQNFLINISLLIFLTIIFSAAMLYIGDHNHIVKHDNLKGLSGRVLKRYTVLPHSSYLFGLIFLYFSSVKLLNDTENIFAFYKMQLMKYFKFFFNSAVILILSIIVYDDLKQFENRIQKRSKGNLAFHNNSNPSSPCWRRVGFWRPFAEGVCEEYTAAYLSLKNGTQKIIFFKK
jgi:hypothetical protein